MAYLAGSIDSTMVTEVIGLAKSALSLFTEFPINVFLIAGLVGVGFKIVKKGKSAAQ